MMQTAELDFDLITCSSAISACSRGEQWQRAFELLAVMRTIVLLPSVITYNAAISACEKGGEWQHALSLLAAMVRNDVSLDVITCSSAISACEKCEQWQQALGLLAVMKNVGLEFDGITCASAMTALSQGLHWRDTLAFHTELKHEHFQQNVDSCGIAMWTWLLGRHWAAALHLFADVQQTSLQPDARGYSAAITASEESQQWDAAVQLFRDMQRGKLKATCVLSVDRQEGQLAQFNFDSVLWPYRLVVGRTFIDRHPHIRTVVGKLGTTSGLFRTSNMEVIAGVNDTSVILDECGLRLEFDYRQVYWNSFLASEREVVANSMDPDDSLLDLCAGVGALSLLCARKGVNVIANDLNPAAFLALQRNADANGLQMHMSQEDARDLLDELFRMASSTQSQGVLYRDVPLRRLHIVFNLPELALEMLAVALRSAGLRAVPNVQAPNITFFVHCYCFGHGDEEVRARLLRGLRFLPEGTLARLVKTSLQARYSQRGTLLEPEKHFYCVEFKFFRAAEGLCCCPDPSL